MAEKKEQNLWKTFLQESSQNQKYTNKSVLVLGKKHSGKRTLLDSLHEISQTSFPIYGQDTNPGKLRIKGISSALDYIFLKVKNLDDQDDETLANVGFYLCDDDQQKSLLDLVMNKEKIDELKMIIIMLDFEEPWVFMDELNKWLGVITELFQTLDIDLKQLDKMKNYVKKQIQKYIHSQYMTLDEKAEKEQKNLNEDEAIGDQNQNQIDDMIIPEGVLENNLGIQMMVVCNKSDLVDSIDSKSVKYIQYSLRKFCIRYGASLLFTSAKNNYNLDNQAELLNSDSIFVPAGLDNLKLLEEMTFNTLDKEQEYHEAVKPPANRQNKKQETQVVDDQEFLQQLKKKYESQLGSSVKQPTQLPKVSQETPNEQTSQQERLKAYYEDLLKSGNQNQRERGSILGTTGGPSEDVKQNQQYNCFQMRRSSVILQRKAESELNGSKVQGKVGVQFSLEDKKGIMDLISQNNQNKMNQKKE